MYFQAGFFLFFTNAYFLPKWLLTPQREINCHIFKMAIFSKFFGDLMSHIIREYADEEIKYFLNVSPLKIVDILLSPFCGIQSLSQLFTLRLTTTCLYWGLKVEKLEKWWWRRQRKWQYVLKIVKLLDI